MRQCSNAVLSTIQWNSSNYSSLSALEVDHLPPTYISIVLIIISTLLCIGGLVGNLFLAVLIRTVKEMETPTNWLVFNLAIADLAIVFITIPYNLINPYISWPFGSLGCKYLIMPTMEHFASVCVLTHTAISLARYVNISQPQEVVTINAAKSIIFLIWLVSFLVLSATLMGFLGEFKLKTGVDDQLVCVLVWKSKLKQKVMHFALNKSSKLFIESAHYVIIRTSFYLGPNAVLSIQIVNFYTISITQVYRICVFTLTHLIPLVATAFSYYKIHLVVKSSLRNVHSHLTRSHLMNRRRCTRHLNTTLMMMFAMFTLITSPLQFFMLFHEFHLFHKTSPHTSLCMFNILLTLFYAQILSNPIILLYKGKQYRDALKDLKFKWCVFVERPRGGKRCTTKNMNLTFGECTVGRSDNAPTLKESVVELSSTTSKGIKCTKTPENDEINETIPLVEESNVPLGAGRNLTVCSTITIRLHVSESTIL